ncbi:MAG: hypothetical protein IJA85_06055 [Clostridia bacterium]|nr:hypothetical protein [Clostridia bacterium]
MENIIITVMWLIFVMGMILPPMILFLIFGRKEDKRRSAALFSLLLLVTEFVVIFLLCLHPPIINVTNSPLSQDSEETIRYVSNGRFNDNTPVFPIAVIVTENSPSLLRWRTFYGIWGSTEHIWDEVNQCYENTDRLWN